MTYGPRRRTLERMDNFGFHMLYPHLTQLEENRREVEREHRLRQQIRAARAARRAQRLSRFAALATRLRRARQPQPSPPLLDGC
jgi:glutathione S-transferase